MGHLNLRVGMQYGILEYVKIEAVSLWICAVGHMEERPGAQLTGYCWDPVFHRDKVPPPNKTDFTFFFFFFYTNITSKSGL